MGARRVHALKPSLSGLLANILPTITATSATFDVVDVRAEIMISGNTRIKNSLLIWLLSLAATSSALKVHTSNFCHSFLDKGLVCFGSRPLVAQEVRLLSLES